MLYGKTGKGGSYGTHQIPMNSKRRQSIVEHHLALARNRSRKLSEEGLTTATLVRRPTSTRSPIANPKKKEVIVRKLRYLYGSLVILLLLLLIQLTYVLVQVGGSTVLLCGPIGGGG